PTALLGNQCAPRMKAERKVRSGASELFGATHFRQLNTSGRPLIISPRVLLSVCGSSACHSSTRDILRQQRNNCIDGREQQTVNSAERNLPLSREMASATKGVQFLAEPKSVQSSSLHYFFSYLADFDVIMRKLISE